MNTYLKVEHRINGHHVHTRFIRPGNSAFTLGSNRDVNLHLMGHDVAGVHAIVEWADGNWRISDLGSATGTWVERAAVVTRPIESAVDIRIGCHSLTLSPLQKRADLFLWDPKDLSQAQRELTAQQIVIRRQGLVLRTEFIGPRDSFEYFHGSKRVSLVPPKGRQWEYDQFGDVVIQKRLVGSPESEERTVSWWETAFDKNMRWALVGSLMALVVLLGLLFFAPMREPGDFAAAKPDNNKYTQMIFDSKKVKKQREKALKQSQSIQKRSEHMKASARADSAPGPNKVAAPKVVAPSQAVSTAVQKIRSSGVGQIIGKISKRVAIRNAGLIVASGLAPDAVGTGRAVASVGSVVNGSAQTKSSGRVVVSGVGTIGSGQGAGSLRGVGGLSVGRVGAGDVGLVEEEGDVEGGLDKEVIASYIKSQLGQIRYCYERQLSANPNLYGKVHVKFTIGSDGTVVAKSIGTTTLRDGMVEGCILRRVAVWKFPEPKGGVQVLVTYPFLFKSTQ